MVLGDGDRAPTPAELERMKALVREAMRDGAVGVSTSLQYAPAPYAKTGGADRAGARRRRSSAASTPRTCAAKATPYPAASTKRSASGARRRSRWRSGT